MNKILPFTIFALIIVGCQSSYQTEHDQVGNISAIDSLLIAEMGPHHFAGTVVQIKRGDSLLHRKAYGYADLYNMELDTIPDPEKMSVNHTFDLASLTKVFATTFGIMLLHDAGKVSLNDPIHKWLPEFSDDKKNKITIRHLLTHSAGLYQWQPTYYHASNRKEQYKYIAGLPLKWEVGQSRHYSDLSFMLLAEIIDRVTGQQFNQFLEERLYSPLGLEYTTYNPKQKGLLNIVATSHGNPFERRMVYDDSFGYDVDVDPESWEGWRDYTLKGEVNDGNAWYAGKGIAGHAGLFSNAADLQKLIDLLLNSGSYQGKQIISSSVIDTFLTEDQFGNGLGWMMDANLISAEGAPLGTFGHTGFTGTSIVVVPAEDLSIIFLTNRQHTGVQPSGYYYNMASVRQQIFSISLSETAHN